MNSDLLRFIDSISRDKNIEKESVFVDLEAAMVSAAKKAYAETEDATVTIDRLTGEIAATVNGKPIDMKTLGRIAAQTAKQVMIQKIREDERSAIFEEYSERVGEVVTGTVVRYEGGGMVINLGRVEGFMPRSEQIPGQTHQAGERVRGMILDVREEINQVRIVLTQTHPDYIRRMFELEVPEVSERIIEIRALSREAGYRTKIAVSSIDSRVDAVGACVGVRGSRIRNIVDELGGEKIDIVRWNESSQVLITNSLKPAEVKEVFLCFELGRATVIVAEDQLSLAIGKRGQNVRLAARLTGWDIDILTPAEYDKNVDDMEKALKSIEGVEDVMLDKLLAIGVISLSDLAEVGVEPLVNELAVNAELATVMVEKAGTEAKRLEVENAARKAAEQAERKASAAASAESGEPALVGAGVGSEGAAEIQGEATLPSRPRTEQEIVKNLAAGWRAELDAQKAAGGDDSSAS
ncbi:MAG: transcription termination factor NusA [Planctomycetes bacterium]|nr:transcription termination factor NusA [Planctomycetota bacterium]MBI3835892.1 transcription termination factor NusA [Planctomycetota bacterium]